MKLKSIVLIGLLSLGSFSLSAKASPSIPAPGITGCDSYIYFDGFMGCIPLFRIMMVCSQ